MEMFRLLSENGFENSLQSSAATEQKKLISAGSVVSKQMKTV
jgi:hypothetical protein